MRYFTPIAALLSLVLFAAEGNAQPPGRGKGKPGAGQQRRGGQGQGQRPGMDRDPAQMVQRMMQEFDKDGDQKLDVRELTALFTAMRERRENGGRPGNAAGQKQRPENGQKGQRPQGAGKGRRGDGENAGKAGGEKPKRPPVE